MASGFFFPEAPSIVTLYIVGHFTPIFNKNLINLQSAFVMNSIHKTGGTIHGGLVLVPAVLQF